ncbi:MAG: hypothetical protein KDJ14_08975 [Xanthomonadales bacterium]|nr:hypothetical protein [Xanthomonadales bacterium]
MTLRWRHYLAVISLVLGLGLASSAVLIRLVTNETEWGMQQRAEGAATSVAEFLPLLEAASPDRRQAMLDDVLARLGDAALQVQAWPLDGAAPRMALAAASMQLPAQPSDTEIETLRERGAAWRATDGEGDAPDQILGFALAYDAGHQPVALVSVAEQDDSLDAALTALRSKLIAVALAMFLVACVVAEWLTRMVQGELGTLCHAASELEGGRSAEAWEPGRIQEINDLGGTLQTMGSLLEDGVQRTRLRFFKAETIPTRHDMAQRVVQRQWKALLQRDRPPGTAWRRLGEPPPEHFLDWLCDDSGWCAVVGTLGEHEPLADTLDANLLAQAVAQHILRTGLGAGANAEAALRGDPLLRSAQLEVVDTREGVCRVLTLGRGGEESSAHHEPVTRHRRLFGTLDEAGMHTARMYVAQSIDRPIDRVAAELESLLGERYSGFLWLCDEEVRS